jgi:uncharacterized protein (TIGR00369 family)
MAGSQDAHYDDLRLRYAAVPAHVLLGLSLEKLGSGVANVRMAVSPSVVNPNGTVHAGVIGAVVHSALLQAARTLLHQEDSLAVVDVNVNFLLPGYGATFVCSAEVVQLGESIGICEARFRDAEEVTLAVATAVLHVTRRQQL